MSSPKHMDFDIPEDGWYKNPSSNAGLRVADTLDEVRTFAFECFDRLDSNGDGFINQTELSDALNDSRWQWREKSFICFLLRRIHDISESYDEEWSCKASDGISRADIQEYFKSIRRKISGV